MIGHDLGISERSRKLSEKEKKTNKDIDSSRATVAGGKFHASLYCILYCIAFV
jgi:hypothetical protein